MPDSKRKIPNNKMLEEFRAPYSSAGSKEEKDMIWGSINTPFIDEIRFDSDHCLVTFLYRQGSGESKEEPCIYLHSDAVGLPLAEKNQLKPISETDIYYLSLVLPSTLRTTYCFIRAEKLTDAEMILLLFNGHSKLEIKYNKLNLKRWVMSKRTIKKYDKEFKQNAVNLCLNNDKHYREIAKDLGIAPVVSQILFFLKKLMTQHPTDATILLMHKTVRMQLNF